MPGKRVWPAAICILVAYALLFAIAFMYQKNHHQQSQHTSHHHHHPQRPQQPQQPKQPQRSKQPKKPKIIWGVDTASKASDSVYKCVTRHYGKPRIWGRYMESKKNISVGLTQKEVSFIHQKDGKILLIYNHFTDATGYDNGMSQAKKAISFAKKMNVPKGTALFADVEPHYPVNGDFIKGWVKTLSSSSYKAGIYGDFSKNSHLRKAYHSAQLNHKPILWSDQPRVGITTKKKAPDFHPAAPKSSKIFVWQYGIDAKKCNIDTDLARSNILSYLW